MRKPGQLVRGGPQLLQKEWHSNNPGPLPFSPTSAKASAISATQSSNLIYPDVKMSKATWLPYVCGLIKNVYTHIYANTSLCMNSASNSNYETNNMQNISLRWAFKKEVYNMNWLTRYRRLSKTHKIKNSQPPLTLGYQYVAHLF